MGRITLFLLCIVCTSLAQNILWTGQEGGRVELLNTNFEDDNAHTLFRPAAGQTVRQLTCGTEGPSLSPSGPRGTLTWSLTGIPFSVSQLYIRIRFGFIDSWENEQAFLTVNGEEWWRRASITGQGRHNVHVCGRSSRTDELETILLLRALRTPSQSVTITIGANLDENVDNEFWTISEFVVYAIGITGPPAPVISNGQGNPVPPPTSPVGVFTNIYTSNFASSTLGWLQGGQPATVFNCGSAGLNAVLRGGNGVSLRWSSSPQPAFNRVRLSLTYTFVDSWDSEEGFITINGIEVWRKRDVAGAQTRPSNLCGRNSEPPRTNDRSEPITVETAVPSGTTTVVIVFGSTLDQTVDNESFVISNVRVDVLRN